MKIRNTVSSFGLVAIIFHWVSAVIAILMLSSGFYMANLAASSSKAYAIEHMHKATGLVFFAIILGRLAWKGLNVRPEALGNDLERLGAQLVHALLYIGLIAMFISGYFVATLGGNTVSFLGIFEVPALIKSQEFWPIAAGVHYVTAIYVLALITLHVLAALRHHYVKKDRVLLRMLGSH